MSDNKKVSGSMLALAIDKMLDLLDDKADQTDLEKINDVAISQIKEQFAVGATDDEISDIYNWSQATVPSEFNSRERGCCYGNGWYVVAGTAGQMVYSHDCVTWTLVPAFTSAVITCLTYGNGFFAAVDSDGNLFTAEKPSGTWTPSLDAGGVINAVRYINNRFIVVGEEGFIATSKNGNNWNVVNGFVDNTVYFTDCAWGNGSYIIVGKEGAVWRSVTLEDWENCSIPGFGDIRAARYINGGFVVGGASGNIAYSSDGVSWKRANNPSSLSISYIRDFAYAEKRTYAFSYASNGQGEIWLSMDNGATWSVALTTAGRLWCAVYGDGRFVASGDNGSIYVLDLDIDWFDEEPSSGESIWYRYVATLSSGDQIISESYKGLSSGGVKAALDSKADEDHIHKNVVTVEGGASISMTDVFGEGPYIIEITEDEESAGVYPTKDEMNEAINTAIGDINSVLDAINGEVV